MNQLLLMLTFYLFIAKILKDVDNYYQLFIYLTSLESSGLPACATTLFTGCGTFSDSVGI